MRPSRDRTNLARLLYPDPQPMESFEEWARAQHGDLVTMGPDELNRELGLARLRALADDEPSSWLRERLPELGKALLRHSRSRR